MIFTLIFALGLPIWLVVEEIARLRGERGMQRAQELTKPVRAEATRAPQPMQVALSRRNA
jgi:hypothetical protein